MEWAKAAFLFNELPCSELSAVPKPPDDLSPTELPPALAGGLNKFYLGL